MRLIQLSEERMSGEGESRGLRWSRQLNRLGCAVSCGVEDESEEERERRGGRKAEGG